MSKTSKNAFVIFNIIFFIVNYFLVPYFPNFLVFGFMPFQLFFYVAGGPVVAIVWGVYFTKFFDTQHAYEKNK